MPTVAEVIKHRLKGTTGHIAVAIWCEEDVIERAKEKGIILGHKPAAEIMDAVDHRQDCSLGITWDTFDYYIYEFMREHPHYRRSSKACQAGLIEPFEECQDCQYAVWNATEVTANLCSGRG